MNLSLFDDLDSPARSRDELCAGACVLRAYALSSAGSLIEAVRRVTAVAPFRFMTTPGRFRMSVGMTNCGDCGWVTDAKGYRYDPIDPQRGLAWPAMPGILSEIARTAAAAAGFAQFEPDSCLINCYEPGSRLSLHQDKNERSFDDPIVSVSLGLPATFLFGGAQRGDRPARIALMHGDVVVWGGPARLRYHGVAPLREGIHPMLGARRINLTFRKAM